MGQLRVKDAEEATPAYLLDENGKKLVFEPCCLDKFAFKQAMLQRKAHGTTGET